MMSNDKLDEMRATVRRLKALDAIVEAALWDLQRESALRVVNHQRLRGKSAPPMTIFPPSEDERAILHTLARLASDIGRASQVPGAPPDAVSAIDPADGSHPLCEAAAAVDAEGRAPRGTTEKAG